MVTLKGEGMKRLILVLLPTFRISFFDFSTRKTKPSYSIIHSFFELYLKENPNFIKINLSVKSIKLQIISIYLDIILRGIHKKLPKLKKMKNEKQKTEVPEVWALDLMYI